jgi:hypothetical protein
MLRYFGGDAGTGESELAARVGAGGGQPESIAMAWRSLAIDQLCHSRVSPRGHGRSLHAGGGSEYEERQDQTAEAHLIDRRRKNPVRRVLE